jgi:hypothetical protein
MLPPFIQGLPSSLSVDILSVVIVYVLSGVGPCLDAMVRGVVRIIVDALASRPSKDGMVAGKGLGPKWGFCRSPSDLRSSTSIPAAAHRPFIS